jgi:hypothetical protein
MTLQDIEALRYRSRDWPQLTSVLDAIQLQLSLDAARLLPPSPEFLIEHGFRLTGTDRGTSRYIIG